MLVFENRGFFSRICRLGTIALLEGPAGGSDSVVLAIIPTNGAWTAAANAPWLHLSEANESGVGSMNVLFSYDANPGPTRSGTVRIGDQTLTVTQAGSSYVTAGTVTTLASAGQAPLQLAVDGAGNVYIADYHNKAIQKWTAADKSLTMLVSGLSGPYGVAVDGAGNVYIADTDGNAILEWTAANSNLTTLVSAGVNFPMQLAVDGAGNVYFPNEYGVNGSYMSEWRASDNTLSRLDLVAPEDAAVDTAGNVYYTTEIPSAYRGVEEWIAANNTLSLLLDSGTFMPPVPIREDQRSRSGGG